MMLLRSVCTTGLVATLSVVTVACSQSPKAQPKEGPKAKAPVSRVTQAATPTGPLVCDRFKIVHNLSGATMSVSLDTDLPDDTQVMVSVSRTYREKGNTRDDYPLDYFEEQSTVGEWRKPRQVAVTHDLFKKALEERQRMTSLAGIGFSLGAVSPEIDVSFTVPISQKNPAFGKNNKNLSGSAVTVIGTMRNVRAEESISYPLGRADAPESQWASADKLLVGRTYRLSRATPLMPDDESLDPLVAVAARKTIPVHGMITVKEVVKRQGDIWYRVEAQTVGVGLLNSAALIGQEIRVEGRR